MRKGILILALLVFSGMVWAQELTLIGPTHVPTLIPFTFFTDLPPTDQFSEATVYLDEQPAATAYPSGHCAILPEWVGNVLSCTIFDRDPSSTGGLTMVFVHSGFAKGDHRIRVSTTGNTSATQELSIISEDVLGGTTLDSLKASMVDVENRLLQITNSLDEYTITIQNLQLELNTNQQIGESQRNNLQQSLDDARIQLESQQGTIDGLNAQLRAVEKEVAKSFKNPFAGEEEINAQSTTPPPIVPDDDENNPPATGFVVGNNAPLIGLGILIVAGALVLFHFRGRLPSIGKKSGPFFEGSMDALFKGVPSREDSSLTPRRFASISREEARLRNDVETNPPEKVNFSELIRKERD
ncbi:MAG: hypothetical protein Q8P05_01760 [Candidatus Diapherotrites archaeon]|nr:hypothetical protein [Candidatus Diapherotrites archaeon]MDZ4256348.1 hypothetical protein [archaeon]